MSVSKGITIIEGWTRKANIFLSENILAELEGEFNVMPRVHGKIDPYMVYTEIDGVVFYAIMGAAQLQELFGLQPPQKGAQER